MWEYLHQGRGRRVYQDNLDLLQQLVPINDEPLTENKELYCQAPSYPGCKKLFDGLEVLPKIYSDTTHTEPSLRSRSGSSKVSTGRRLTNFLIQSGACDPTSFRQWFVAQEELREEYEELVFSKKWKELVDEVMLLGQEDFRRKSWEDLLEINSKTMSFDESVYLDVEESYTWVVKILIHNEIDEQQFFNTVYQVMNKQNPKLNCLWIMGDSNAGKSLICNSIIESVRFFVCINEFDEFNGFPLGDTPGKRAILINEPSCAAKRIELLKNVMEGQEIAISVKHQKGVTMKRTPIFVASNWPLWRYCSNEKEAVLNRCYMFNFKPFSELEKCRKKIHPMVWYCMLKKHTNVELFKKEQSFLQVLNHRNWKRSGFPIEIPLHVLDLCVNVEQVDETMHISSSENCSLCDLSNLISSIDFTNKCMGCDDKTVYIFCPACINVLETMQ